MKILIDATGIPREKAGVGVYARNLLDRLTRNPGTLEFFILAQNDDREMNFGHRPNVTMLWVPARFFRILPIRFLLEQLFLPVLLVKYRIQVLHSLHYAFPLLTFGTHRVVTFHDMTFFTMPEFHQRLKIVYFRFFMRASVRLVDHMIFVSRSALDDCTAQLGPIHGGASVVPHGKSDEFRPDISLDVLNAVRKKYNLHSRFILYIGTIEPRKNLPRLVEAFAPIARRDPDIHLVIAGKIGWMAEALFTAIKRLDLTSRVTFTGFVSEEDKPALLATCTIFVYPSLYEGFGLPALEALASGAPTVTSNTSSLPEVVGQAAWLVDPTSTEDIQQALETILADTLLQQELHRAGPLQAAQFTWERTATLTIEAYRSCMHSQVKERTI